MRALSPDFRSLRLKVVVPMLVVAAIGVFALTVSVQRNARRNMDERIMARSNSIANAVVAAAETLATTADLHRFVCSMGAEPEVNLIVVAGGTPLRIVASTRNEFLGRPWSDYLATTSTPNLPATAIGLERATRAIPDESEVIVTAPTYLLQRDVTSTNATSGFVLVRIDTQAATAELRETLALTTTIHLAVIVGITAVALLLLGVHVLRPIKVITRAVEQRKAGDTDRTIPQMAADEIGFLAAQLNAAFAHTRIWSERLAEQKAALDEHAIVAVTDVRGTITYVNEKFCALSGYSDRELIGQNHRMLNSGHHPPEFFTEIWRTITAGRIWHGEICNRRKDDSLYWVDSTIVPFLDTNGKPRQFIAIRTDITERKQQEEQIRVAKEHADALAAHAERATQAKSAFLAMMSHEIRTPMNGVIGFTGLLVESGLTPQQREWAETIESSGRTLLTVINDVLDFSKLESGKIDLERIPFSPESVIKEVLAMTRINATSKNLALRFVHANIPAAIVGDPVRIKQVALNLVSNAIKFTAQGEVCVSLIWKPAGGSQHGVFRVEVRDTGIGISPEQANGLFQEFSQADSSTTRRFGGTGLGLAISRRLIEMMEGSIGLQSDPGQGSTFYFTLPSTALPASALTAVDPSPAESHATSSDAPRLKVLLAEDVLVNQKLAKALLTRNGCDVDIASDGVEAVAKAGRQKYDIIFMDCQMPEMDGYDATRRIRERELTARGTGTSPTRRVPIIAMTAHALAGDREKCLDSGMDDYLTKPVNVAQLKAALVRWHPQRDDCAQQDAA